jgi:glutathione S-transferase
MVVVHHLENSRSQRVLWLLEELGVEYEVRRYERNPKTLLAPPELFKVHPLGKSPVITHGDVVVAESGAIMEYLVDVFGNGRLRPPAGTAQALQYRYWMHFAEGSAMPPLVMKLVFDRIEQAPVPFFIKPILKAISGKVNSEFIMPNIQRQLEFMESHLSSHAWFAGEEFSAADIQMSFPLEAASSRAEVIKRFPRVVAFVERIHGRPAYRKALERGGPYAYA